MKNIITVGLISIFLILNGCQKDEPTAPDTTPPHSQGVIIPPTTKSIDSLDYKSNLINLSSDSSTFTFRNEFVSKYSLKVNDVMVITSGYGMLRKITLIKQDNGNSIITTTQAALTDAIQQGRIVLDNFLEKMEVSKINYYGGGVTCQIAKKTESKFYYDFDINKVLYDFDEDTTTTDDQVRLIGDFSISCNPIFKVIIEDPFILDSVVIGLESINQDSLRLVSNLNYTLEKEIKLATIDFGTYPYLLGNVLVIIHPKLEIKAGINGYANAAMTMGVKNRNEFSAGIQFVRGAGWNTFQDTSNQLSFEPPVLTANAGGKAYIKPEFSIATYGVLSGYANAEGYGEIQADINSNPWWQVFGGLDFNVGARAEIFGIQLFDYEKTVLQLRWLLAQAAGNIPEIPMLTAPPDQAPDLPIQLTLSWDQSSEALHYQLQVATDNLFTNLIYDHDGITITNQQIGGLQNSTKYFWRVRASNLQGKSGWSEIWYFTTIAEGGLDPYPPDLASPNNGATDINVPTTFIWNASIGAESYNLQVSNDQAFSDLVYDQSGISSLSRQVSNLQYGTNYYWRVNASNSNGTSNWSDVWSFTTITDGNDSTFIDSRDGQSYKVVKIGDKYWLAENLNYRTNSSFYYNNDSLTYNQYGRLYSWQDAQNACPPGWHIPSHQDWIDLALLYGGFNLAGGALKESGTEHWNPPNTGATNESKYTALPGGWCNFNINNFQFVFHDMNVGARFWSTTTYEFQGYTLAYILRLADDDTKAYFNDSMELSVFYNSVRCIKDE